MKPIDQLIREKPSGPLYHYTTTSGFLGVLDTGALWATSHLHLNDRREHKVAARLLEQEAEESSLTSGEKRLFKELLKAPQNTAFILSFSEHGDRLSQWRAYSPSGNGYSLGFNQDNPLFRFAPQHSFNLVKCEYEEINQRKFCRELIESFAENFTSAKSKLEDLDGLRAFFRRYDWSYKFMVLAASFKDRGFLEECEWRLVSQGKDIQKENKVKYRSGRCGVTPYFELPLCFMEHKARLDRLIVGPNANKVVARRAAKMLLEARGMTNTEIEISQTPLRY